VSNFSTEKMLQILSVFSKDSFTYQVLGKKQQNFFPPKFLYISPMLFRSYRCLEKCGWCCCGQGTPFSLDYYPFNFDKFKKDYPDHVNLFVEKTVFVNGEKKLFYSYDQLPAFNNQCNFLNLDDRRCNIHDENPFSCRWEILKGIKRGKSGYLTKQMFGRGWVVRNGNRALCELGPFDKKQFQEDLNIIREFQDFACYFGIETWFPKIVKILEELKLDDLPKEKIPVGINKGKIDYSVEASSENKLKEESRVSV